MIVEIETSLFFDNSKHNDLDKFFDFFIENRYDFYVDDEKIFKSEWNIGARKSKKDFLKKSFVNSAYLPLGRRLKIGTTNNDLDNEFTLADGYIFLNAPVLVFMENSYYDGKCYLGLLSKFKSADRINEFYRKRWLEFKNCGGKNGAINQINAILKAYRKEALENHKYLKAILIIDSDKKTPTDTVNNDDFIQYFTSKNICVHTLEKREIENYLPMEALESQVEKISLEKLNALKDLTPIQLDYYDYEKGFNTNSKRKLNDLYKDISDGNYTLLKQGLDKAGFRTKGEIPKLFYHHSITKELLLERCEHQNTPKELERLIEKINELL